MKTHAWGWLGVPIILVGVVIVIAAIATDDSEEIKPNYGVLWGLLISMGGIVVALTAFVLRIEEEDKKSRAARRAWLSRWDQIRHGMAEWEVRGHIGTPNKTDRAILGAGQTHDMWWYGRWPVYGTVMFQNGRVVSMFKPRR